MEPEIRPRAPFAAWAPQWVNPRIGFVWISEQPAAIVTQCMIEHVTPEAVNWLHDVLDGLISSGFVEQHPGVVAIHDWRMARSIDALARSTYRERTAMRVGSPFRQAGPVYVALTASRIVRMTISAVGLAMQLATGQPPIRVIDDPAGPLDTYRIRTPGLDTWRRIRIKGINA